MVFKLPVWMVAVALAGVTGSARADIAFDGRLSNFGYSLIDLAPDDGIAPALTFQFQGYAIGGRVREGPWLLNQQAPAAIDFNKIGLYDRDGTVFRGASLPNSSASVGISGAFADHSFNAFSRGRVHVDQSVPDFGGEYNAASLPARLSMSLAPMTQMVWSGTLSLFGENTLGRRGARTETNDILGSVAIHNAANTEVYEQISKGFYLRGEGRQRDVSDFSLVYSNLGSGWVDVGLTASMRGYGEAMSPVPEPGAHWLLLCGVGVLAGWRRFNKHRPD